MLKKKQKSKEKTVKEVCDIIFSLEEKYDLNHMKIQGVYVWQLIRFYMYIEISKKIGVFHSPPQQRTLTLKDKIFSFLPFIKNSIFSNPLSGNYHKDILLFDHPRRVLYDGEYKDIYSYFLIDELEDLDSINIKSSYEVIESPYLNKHYTKKEDYIKYNDRILLGSYINKKLSKLKFETEEIDKINALKRELKSSFNIKIDLFNIMKTHILDFKYHYKKYDKLFKKRTPKYVFVVVAYENKSMIAAAKNNGVEVIELQHGTISKYHLGYSYPNPQDKDLKYFPDKILSFGEYWKDVSDYPIDKEKIISIGFPYLDETIESFRDNKKNKNQILFISQGVIGKYLSEFAYELAKGLGNKEKETDKLENKEENNDYQIIYKLHPGEYYNWENNYKLLKKANEYDNFTVIDNSEKPLYELFSKSEYQIGVFSTAIYEGLLFNCKTFLVDLPGVYHLNDLVKKDYVKKIKDPNEFIESISDFKINNYDRDFFFKKYNKNVLKKILKNN